MSDLIDYQVWTRTVAKYPEAESGSALALAYVGLGLGEAGEVQGKIKKVLRDDNGEVTDKARSAILDEAGDVLWYLARLFDELGTDFEEVSRLNMNKLEDRKERDVIGGSGDNR